MIKKPHKPNKNLSLIFHYLFYHVVTTSEKRLFRVCLYASYPFTIYTYQKLVEAAAETKKSA